MNHHARSQSRSAKQVSATSLTVWLTILLCIVPFFVFVARHFVLRERRQIGRKASDYYPVRALGAEYEAFLPVRDADVNNRTTEIRTNLADGEQKMILVLDYWERMVNINVALRRLVQIAVEADFTVVEPLMYESKANRYMAFREQFEAKRIVPQTAALYFQTDGLYKTGRYVSQREFYDRIRGSHSIAFYIDAAVIIDWDGAEKFPSGKHLKWCDHRLSRYARSSGSGLLSLSRRRKLKYPWKFTENVYVQRALCLSPKGTVLPATFKRKLLDDMFDYARRGTDKEVTMCPNCVALAIVNYRKHALAGFVDAKGVRTMSQPNSMIPVGRVPLHLADKLRTKEMNGSQYVATQIRTGKPFTLFQNWEKRQRSKGVHYEKNDAFKSWLNNCTRSLISKAKELAQDLGPDMVFYIASDMYNDGWKGGERASYSIEQALDQAKNQLEQELTPLIWLQPERLQISQDIMGMSGLVDAAACVRAERFVHADPSSFGSWVRAQRGMLKIGNSFSVDCKDKRIHG